ncbi:MAG TPA: gas vesicle protein [Pseudonocardiaceae bacterium]|jgi:dsDNA-specific endonuclease/ATPase MutS2|nr:gas vesicle protein [Pseudonocardiaceae bacterium]
MSVQPIQPRRSPDSLADVLERVLDKGVVIVGDILVDILDIELLSIKLRLFISSAQTAKEMGMDWWTNDPFYSSGRQESVANGRNGEVESADDNRDELESLRKRVHELESQVRDNGRSSR